MSPLPHCSKPVYPKGLSPAPLASRVRRDDPAGCQVALLGLSDDLGIRLNNGRPGAKDGPAVFRQAFAKYGVAEPYGWEWPAIFDAGDIIPAEGTGVDTLAETHARVTAAVKAILDLGLFPIAIGGGHDLTFPFVRGVIEWTAENTPATRTSRSRSANPTPGWSGLYFDAHLDVRPTPGSGMPFRALIEECDVESLTVHGLNPFANTRDHVQWFLENGGRFGDDDALSIDAFDGPAFVSFDLDVLDASVAPGVSAINPAGWTSALAEMWLGAVGQDPNVRCFDLMEFNPANDPDGRTARVAVHLFLSFLHGFAQRKPSGPERGGRR